jgi:antirestriction protein
MNMDSPRVWVGCLGCYNHGNLIGKWFEATEAPTEVKEFDAKVELGRAEESHKEFGHEELWVMDHEGFHGLLTGEFSPTDGARVGAVIEELGDQAAAYGVWRSIGKGSGEVGNEEDVEQFRESYRGLWDSEVAYVENYIEETNLLDAMPEDLRGYFDTKSYAHDLFMSDYASSDAPGSQVYVFDNHS